MTYTKRQFFLYRLNQSLKALAKSVAYLYDVIEYIKESKYEKKIKKKHEQLKVIHKILLKFYNKAK